jgi:RNA polymerase-binding transcription factor DksA
MQNADFATMARMADVRCRRTCMSRLTTGQLQHLDALMDARHARELAEINAIAARSRDERRQQALAGPAADRLDVALAEMALASEYAMVRQDIQDVRDILAARRRMAAGEYGTCSDCGEEIGYARLLAYPTARRCIHCQRLHEQRQTAAGTRRAQ